MNFGIPSKRTLIALADLPIARRPRFVAGCSSCGVICAMGREGMVPDMSCSCCKKEGRRSELGVKMRRPTGTIHHPIPIGPIAEHCRNTIGDALAEEAFS